VDRNLHYHFARASKMIIDGQSEKNDAGKEQDNSKKQF